jgi:hypothetical protein
MLVNKNILAIRREAKAEGIKQGFEAYEAAALLAAYNVNERGEKRYMSRPQFQKFFREWEDELARLYYEEYAKFGDNFAEVVIEHTMRLREEMGLECE